MRDISTALNQLAKEQWVMMTAKDFQAVAKALRCVKPEPGDYSRAAQWHADVRAVAQACAEANPAFDRLRFYEACGVT